MVCWCVGVLVGVVWSASSAGGRVEGVFVAAASVVVMAVAVVAGVVWSCNKCFTAAAAATIMLYALEYVL